MLILASLFLLAVPIHNFNVAHRKPPVGVAAPVAPKAPDAR
jgi:hypothetical protein